MRNPQSSPTAPNAGRPPGRLSRLRLALEPALRRLFHLYWRFQRGMTLGVRALVIDERERIFLVQHSYVAGWHFPGGGVEVGETLRAALARELAEEANIELAGPAILHGVYLHARVSPRDHVALFVVRAFRQIAPPVANREIADHGFFPLDALPAGTTAGTRARIAEVLHGAPTAEIW